MVDTFRTASLRLERLAVLLKRKTAPDGTDKKHTVRENPKPEVDDEAFREAEGSRIGNFLWQVKLC